MATYFVNAELTHTPTPPFATPNTGARNFTSLLAVVGNSGSPFADGDIVEVCGGVEIDDSSTSSLLELCVVNAGSLTVRSYGLPDGGGKDPNSLDRFLNKPVIKLHADGSLFMRSAGFALNTGTFQNLKVYKDTLVPTNDLLSIASPSVSTAIVIGCHVWNEKVPTSWVGDGIFISASILPTAKVINNICCNMQYGIYGTGAPSNPVEIFNNTTYNCKVGILWVFNTAGKVCNNIIHGNGISASTGISSSSMDNPLVDYNNVYMCDAPYVSVTPQHPMALDPLFRDALNRDFRLDIGSPCIDAGVGSTTVPGIPTNDFYNKARPNLIAGTSPVDDGTDMGAHEYYTQTVPVPKKIQRSAYNPTYVIDQRLKEIYRRYMVNTSGI